MRDDHLVVRVIEDGDDDTFAHAEGDNLDDGSNLTEGFKLCHFLLASDEPVQTLCKLIWNMSWFLFQK